LAAICGAGRLYDEMAVLLIRISKQRSVQKSSKEEEDLPAVS